MESYEGSRVEVFEIYVAPLAAYSTGRDTGCWITVTKNEDELRASIETLLKDCPYSTADSDWRVHDYRGFYGVGNSLGEHPSLSDLSKTVELIEIHGEMAAKLIDHFCGDVDEAVRHLNDKYLGAYGSLTEYAEQSVQARIEGKIPDLVAPYVDYEAMARDWDLGGEIFAIEVGSISTTGEEQKVVHIFSNRPTS